MRLRPATSRDALLSQKAATPRYRDVRHAAAGGQRVTIGTVVSTPGVNMESVNELLKLFMRQARQERRVRSSFDAAPSYVPARQLEHAKKIRSSKDSAQVAEAHDHD
jgi:hypothetical protein